MINNAILMSIVIIFEWVDAVLYITEPITYLMIVNFYKWLK